MENEPIAEQAARSDWRARQVYAMAVISLAVGLTVGYLFRGSQSHGPSPQPAVAQQVPAAGGMGGQMPSLGQMKQMADQKAAPLLERLKSDPNNRDLLLQVGSLYLSTHQFKEAADYFGRALQVDPKNVAVRTQMASCLYYSGDVDGAISQLQQGLRYDPKDVSLLFNLGIIEWQGKHDSQAAVATWQQLLKSNPQLSADRKANLQKMIADVQMHAKS